MENRNMLLKRMQICDFACHEAALFLDTHPRDKAALEYFDKYNKMSKEVHQQYVDQFGPVVPSDSTNLEKWEWIEKPWPWEKEV